MINSISWFEIPVTNMDRAKAFYETVFDVEIKIQDFGGVLMGWFPQPDKVGVASGSLIQHESYVPSAEGVLLYFSSDDVNVPLLKVNNAGGKIFQEKTQISTEYGYMAVFLDTEGNRIALHSIS